MSQDNQDLFDTPELIPNEVHAIFSEYKDCTYEDLGQMLVRLNKIGYTFDFYLNAIPYNLRKL